MIYGAPSVRGNHYLPSRASRHCTHTFTSPCLSSGSERTRLPVAAKIALHSAGAIGDDARLADAAPEAAGRHEHGLDLRHRGEPRQRVVVEIALHDAAVLDGDLVVQGRRQRPDTTLPSTCARHVSGLTT